jgi:flagellar biosynthesis protein FlhB
MALTTWLIVLLMVLSAAFDAIALLWHYQDRKRMARDEARLDRDEAEWHGQRTNDS